MGARIDALIARSSAQAREEQDGEPGHASCFVTGWSDLYMHPSNDSSAGPTVVVGVDFSPESEEALAMVLRTPGVRVHAAHVLSLGIFTRQSELHVDANVMHQRLVDLCAKHDLGLCNALQPCVILGDDEADALVRLAEDAGAQLIALGSGGHGGLRRVFHRSVAERVIRAAPCPVLVARQPANVAASPAVLLPASAW